MAGAPHRPLPKLIPRPVAPARLPRVLANLLSVTVGPDGRFYVASGAFGDPGPGKTWSRSLVPEGGAATQFNVGGSMVGPNDLVFDGGNLFVVSYHDNLVSGFDRCDWQFHRQLSVRPAFGRIGRDHRARVGHTQCRPISSPSLPCPAFGKTYGDPGLCPNRLGHLGAGGHLHGGRQRGRLPEQWGVVRLHHCGRNRDHHRLHQGATSIITPPPMSPSPSPSAWPPRP